MRYLFIRIHFKSKNIQPTHQKPKTLSIWQSWISSTNKFHTKENRKVYYHYYSIRINVCRKESSGRFIKLNEPHPDAISTINYTSSKKVLWFHTFRIFLEVQCSKMKPIALSPLFTYSIYIPFHFIFKIGISTGIKPTVTQ